MLYLCAQDIILLCTLPNLTQCTNGILWLWLKLPRVSAELNPLFSTAPSTFVCYDAIMHVYVVYRKIIYIICLIDLSKRIHVSNISCLLTKPIAIKHLWSSAIQTDDRIYVVKIYNCHSLIFCGNRLSVHLPFERSETKIGENIISNKVVKFFYFIVHRRY